MKTRKAKKLIVKAKKLILKDKHTDDNLKAQIHLTKALNYLDMGDN